MGMRKYYRSIAKGRLKCMGVKSNRLGSGIMPPNGEIRKKMRHPKGRAYLQMLREKKPAVWQRVIFGDLAKEGLTRQLLEGQRIKRREMAKKAMKKRRIRKVITAK